MTFFGIISCIKCKRKIQVPNNETKQIGNTSETKFEMYCPYCNIKFIIQIIISTTNEYKPIIVEEVSINNNLQEYLA